MSVVYILAHLDDEYAALPMIWAAQRQGLVQHFVYLADYRGPALAARRLAETRTFLQREGLSPDSVRPLGLGSGIYDGALHRAAGALLTRLRAELESLGPVSQLVTPAWEGGHMDHDTCAALAVRLASEAGVGVRQFSLYNGAGTAGVFLRGATPLAANGPVHRQPLSGVSRLRWAAAVAAFPSQLYAWSGIWPAMMWSVAWRGFGWQTLEPARIAERPHDGPLFYERMFKVPYAEVRAALDEALLS